MASIGTVAVVGAGVAGLACALALGAAGCDVTVFDKGARPGGRLATRESGGMTFDHGAQFVAAHNPPFRAVLARLEADRVVMPWSAAMREGRVRFAGVPGMSAIGARMAEWVREAGGRVETARQVVFLRSTPEGWILRHAAAAEVGPGAVVEAGDTAGPFEAILLAVPSPQAAALLRPVGHRFAAAAMTAGYAPCLAAMAAFAEHVAAADVVTPGEGPLGWVAREASRPGRAATADGWTLHAGAAWSAAHLERPMAEVAPALLDAFRDLTGATARPVYLRAHRWRYARVSRALGESCLWDGAARLGLCGDWCLGPRVEAAYDSGLALASTVLGRT